MGQKQSILPVISLAISVIALSLFLLNPLLSSALTIFLWIGLSYIAPFFPILSKFCRSRSGKYGDGLEIAALVIGLINFDVLLDTTTRLHFLNILAFIALIAVLYAKAFNDTLYWTRLVKEGKATFSQIQFQIPGKVLERLEALRDNPQEVATFLAACVKSGDVKHLFVDILQKEFAPLPSPTSPAVPSPVQERVRFCRRCGQPLIDGMRFCTHCGTEKLQMRECNTP